MDGSEDSSGSLAIVVAEMWQLEYAQGFLGGFVILFTEGEVVIGSSVLGFQHGVEAASGGSELSANIEELFDVAGLVVVAGAVVVGVDVGRFDGYIVLDVGGSFLPVLHGIVGRELEMVGESVFESVGNPIPVLLKCVVSVVCGFGGLVDSHGE